MVLAPQRTSPPTSPAQGSPPRRIGVGGVRTSDLARQYVGAVLDSDHYSPGEFCRRFESKWAALHYRRYAVFVNSGTSALHIALAALKEKYLWPDGAKVVVPALTFVASVNTVIQSGLVPFLVDIDEHYGLRVIEEPPAGTVAVMPVHVNGQQAEMDTIAAWASAYDLVVVEDSCECVSARFADRLHWGEVSCYSTYGAHHVATGVGGFACTNDPYTANLMRSLANHGRDAVYFDRDAPQEKLVARRFNFERHGFSYRASEFEAAVGCAQLPDLATSLERRRQIADSFSSDLTDLPLVLPQARPKAQWWPMFYPVLAPERDALCLYLERCGIETRRFLPLTDQPVYRGMFGRYPAAERVNAQGMYWGCHPEMTDDDVSYVVRTVHDFFWR